MVTAKTVLTGLADSAPGPVLARSAQRTRGIWRVITRSWFKKVLFLVSDLVMIATAHRLAEGFTLRWLRVPLSVVNPPNYYLFYVPLFALVISLFGGYKNPDLRRPEKELELMCKAVSCFFVVLVCANFLFFRPLGFSRYLMMFWYGMALFFVLADRFSLRKFYGILWRKGVGQKVAILAGPADRWAAFRQKIGIQRYQGYELAGIVVDRGAHSANKLEEADLPVLGTLDDLENIVREHDVQLVLLNLRTNDLREHSYVPEFIRRCHTQGTEVEVYSGVLCLPEFSYERDEFSGFFHVYSPPRWSQALQQAVKKVLDVCVGIVGSAVTILITPIIALLIKREDGGPVFYRSEFVGHDGAVRYYLKFRTMVKDADQLLEKDPALKRQFERTWKLKEDPRTLRIGRILRKYSIDEFPEFFSLLTGTLSFVGPRTISGAETVRYGEKLPILLSVKPGLTGYWQVTGRQTTTYEERVRMDMFYIEQWSIWLDFLIIAKTFWSVFRAEGAY